MRHRLASYAVMAPVLAQPSWMEVEVPWLAVGGLPSVGAPARLDGPPPMLRHAEPTATVGGLALADLTPHFDRPGALDVVRWTSPRAMTVRELAGRFGMKAKSLRTLNPGMPSMVGAGAAVIVYRARPDSRSHSIGEPGRGRLRGAVALPEGSSWRLRSHRRRSWGTETTVRTLVSVFEEYGRTFPDAPRISIGDLSGHHGGRSRPHVSHQSGRDVDIGYVHNGTQDPHGRFRNVNAQTFDAAKNWFLVRELVDSGEVQMLLVGGRVRRMLRAEAAKELPPEALARYFGTRSRKRSGIIRGWRGHNDHMHVRFRCAQDDGRCQSNPSAR